MSEPSVQGRGRVDVVVIGGGAAGLAAALQLGRARRAVVVIDGGEPRNAPAAHVHGYLGHEGIAPAELLAKGRDEVRRYGVEVVDDGVTEVTRGDGGAFRAQLAGGQAVVARRVLVATGLVDVLPDIDGVVEQWGRGVIHCPYCHGWEVRDRPLVVIATSPAEFHQAALFRQWSDDVTLIVHDGPGPDGETRAQLVARRVTIVEEPVATVVTEQQEVTGVRLASGTVLVAGAVVVGPRFTARAEAVRALGIAPVPEPMGFGEVIATDPSGATTVAGVYAAGNAADVRNQVLQAAAEGSRVATVINADLIAEDTAMAMAAAPASVDEWDERYASHDHQLWSGRPNGVLVAEMSGRAPGRALDVGCGEGADAIWLAGEGWQVAAVDVSRVALDRAQQAARDAGVSVDWIDADIVADPPALGAYDLVSVHYPALLHTPDDDAIRALLGAVATGGTLLAVGHAPMDPEYARSRGFDPADYVQPADVAARLDDDWSIQVDETRPRTTPAPHDSPHTHDCVVRAQRLR